MVKRERTKAQTTIYKALRIKTKDRVKRTPLNKARRVTQTENYKDRPQTLLSKALRVTHKQKTIKIGLSL
jgi:hypothetical protein